MTMLKHAVKQNGKFLNPVPTRVATGSFSKTLWAYLTNRAEVVPLVAPDPFETKTDAYEISPATGLRITWIGHSSVLIEVDGVRLLTDPVWSNRASFSNFIGPKRFFAPPLSLQDLPQLDAILISHDHYDHLDAAAISVLAKKAVPFICSEGVGKYLIKWGVKAGLITELNWTDTTTLTNGCRITAVPARHFSGRGLHNRFGTLWSSFVIKGLQHTVYFGADSGWYEGFEAIGETYGPFDLTMLEIGAYNANWADIHMGPDNAAKAHLALRGKLMMPIHWGTFNLALHPWREPIERLLTIAQQKNISLLVPQPGLPVNALGHETIMRWWERNH